jgi:cystathionine beta-lyase/cystathionine gamma-synthase
MPPTPSEPHASTICARATESPASSSRPLVPPIELSVVFRLDDLAHVDALYEGRAPGFTYGRDGHPNAHQLADKLARLEGAEAGLICASGMGAIASALLSLLDQGDHVLLSDGSTAAPAHWWPASCRDGGFITRSSTRLTSGPLDPR